MMIPITNHPGVSRVATNVIFKVGGEGCRSGLRDGSCPSYYVNKQVITQLVNMKSLLLSVLICSTSEFSGWAEGPGEKTQLWQWHSRDSDRTVTLSGSGPQSAI